MINQKNQYFRTLVKEIQEIIVFFCLLKVLLLSSPKNQKTLRFFCFFDFLCPKNQKNVGFIGFST